MPIKEAQKTKVSVYPVKKVTLLLNGKPITPGTLLIPPQLAGLQKVLCGVDFGKTPK